MYVPVFPCHRNCLVTSRKRCIFLPRRIDFQHSLIQVIGRALVGYQHIISGIFQPGTAGEFFRHLTQQFHGRIAADSILKSLLRHLIFPTLFHRNAQLRTGPGTVHHPHYRFSRRQRLYAYTPVTVAITCKRYGSHRFMLIRQGISTIATVYAEHRFPFGFGKEESQRRDQVITCSNLINRFRTLKKHHTAIIVLTAGNGKQQPCQSQKKILFLHNRQITIVLSVKIQKITEYCIIIRLFFSRSAHSDSSPDRECPWPG